MTETYELRGLNLVACLSDAPGKGIWITLAPDGEVRSKSGDFIVDAQGAALAIAAFEEHGVDGVIDYEHQTLGGEFSSPDGTAPAAGWFKQLKYVPGKGLVALVEWTAKAREEIKSAKYKYLSPVVAVRKSDRRLVQLHSAGLTNKPAIPGMERVAAKDCGITEIKIMAEEPGAETTGTSDPGIIVGEIKALLDIEGLEDNADIITILKAIRDDIKGKSGGDGEGETSEGGTEESASKELLAAIGKALKIEGKPDTDTIVSKFEALEGKADQLVSMRKELDDVNTKLQANAVADILKPFIDKGVLNPEGNKDQYKRYQRMAARDSAECIACLDELVATLPPEGRTTAPASGSGGKQDRKTIIAKASAVFDADGTEGRLTDRASAISMALHDAGKKRLTDDEVETLAA